MLATVDLSQRMDRATYKKRLLKCEARLHTLAWELYRQKRSLVVVAEGWDAAGKGGALRRTVERIDPRGYQVFGIAAPKGEDKTHHYLWRFWRRLKAPDEKQILIFDRSWYGRVLVERVEGFATEAEWRRAYREINDFERQLIAHGMILVKLWFHISKEEQLARFEARRDTPHKQWKLTDEDWRNRDQWEAYERAVDHMLRKTSTLTAPWTIIEGNDKLWARIKTQQTLIDAVATALDTDGASERPRVAKPSRKSSG